MRRLLFVFAAAISILSARAQDDDSPPIEITSPDQASTFSFATVKTHSLVWDAKEQMLFAQITFTDDDPPGGWPTEDTHQFRLPGITFDSAKGIFYATSARGEVIPVAKMRHQLFLKVIEALPNAIVRIQHPRGHVNVTLEALKPDDPALHAPAKGVNPDVTRSIDPHELIH